MLQRAEPIFQEGMRRVTRAMTPPAGRSVVPTSDFADVWYTGRMSYHAVQGIGGELP